MVQVTEAFAQARATAAAAAATTAMPAAQSGKNDMFSRIRAGKIIRAPRIVIHGPPGVGKTTFGAASQSPIFLSPENGSDLFDVARFPVPQTYEDVMLAVRQLQTEKHDFRTLVIDTSDAIEPIFWKKVCRDAGKKRMVDIGYGKGYEAAAEMWRALCSSLDSLRDMRKMTIIVLAHSMVRTFANPTGDDYDRYEMKTHKHVSAILREWCDIQLFAQQEEFVRERNGKVRATSTDIRYMHSVRTSAWDAKSRFNIPQRLPLDWEELEHAINVAVTGGTSNIIAEIRENLMHVDEDTQAKVLASIDKAGDNQQQLSRIKNKLCSIVAETQRQHAELHTDQDNE